jgi:hypothetical protein
MPIIVGEDVITIVEAIGERFKNKGFIYQTNKYRSYAHIKRRNVWLADLFFTSDHVDIDYTYSIYRECFEYCDPAFPNNIYRLITHGY